jgi:NifB/MoaA-like Fe-S oxidoreductase
VSGSIDFYEFTDHKLMSLASGKLFFPVKAEIRKKIGKEAGDYVVISLFGEPEIQETEDAILQCFKDEPTAYRAFLKKTEEEKQAILIAIRSAKNTDAKADLIIKSINKLLKEM